MAGSSIVSPYRAKVIEPGMPALDPGVERYQVKGGGAVVIALEPGDRLEIIDVEGRQPGELVVFSPDGKGDAAAIGSKATRAPKGIRAILSGQREDAVRVRAGLERRGLDLGRIKAIPLFTPDSPAGETVDFAAVRSVICVIAAPGGPMSVHDQAPSTDLLIFVTRTNPKSTASASLLPEPLAEPRLDFRVGIASALNYEVKAGEYIQIIDVEGRQCSDFLAFVRRDLDRGRVNGLDATTTRTLNGAAYPGPGLFSKFFSMDMQGLVEVVQDTVGRHDTFNLACTARYYEDMGYFGHANCSENFNVALTPFAIEDRKGWPAINFFFNTMVDDLNVIHFDQPFSRPGDYVLLRALTDLVCASSSCPCDVDAANGWHLSEIHVRVYPADCFFKKAVAYRMTPDAPAQLTKETGFHAKTSARTRNFTEYRGYWLPTAFNNHGAIDEYWACRERAVVMDLSPLRKYEVLGPDSEELMQATFTRNVRKLAIGQVAYGALCYEHGGMIDDGTLFRLGPDNFRWIGGDDYGGIWLREQAEKLGLKVWVKSATDQIHNIAVQGPKSRDILKEFVWTPPAQPTLEELAWFRFAIGRIDDYHGRPILVSRTGYTGELGYEIFCHPDDAPLVWAKAMAAGEPHGIAPLGLDALDILRIEAGLIFAGYEFDDQTDPFEAGIGFSVALKHDEDFIGRSALEKRKASPQRQLVGLELVGNEQASPGDCVHIGRAHIGDVTSACRSPILKKSIALARINAEYAELGAEVEIGKLDGHQKRLPATVVRFPFYDPEKTRVRS
ncbi:MAG: aminomethyltransferase family protein [Alphaproteobacteria bacterium]|nr:aminomethyltransferase family protein [Alphaproteobacteria bacterium]